MSIETKTDADRAHYELEDAYNAAVDALVQARYHAINQLDYREASIFTERAEGWLSVIAHREAGLIDWQVRQEADHG